MRSFVPTASSPAHTPRFHTAQSSSFKTVIAWNHFRNLKLLTSALIQIFHISSSLNPSLILNSLPTSWKSDISFFCFFRLSVPHLVTKKVKIIIIDRALLIALNFLFDSPQTMLVCAILSKCTIYTKFLTPPAQRITLLLHQGMLRLSDMPSLHFSSPHQAHLQPYLPSSLESQ